jgi:hypothetical protein
MVFPQSDTHVFVIIWPVEEGYGRRSVTELDNWRMCRNTWRCGMGI